MGGQMQQSNAAATALYDHPGGGASLHNPGPGNDAGDAVMARWLQSAGLQHLASPLASNGIDHRLLPNLLMQGYGAQSAEEKQRLFKLMRNLNFNGESGSEPYTPTAQSYVGVGAPESFYSPEFRGDFGAGLLDLHAMDDTELLSEHVISEPFEPSPFLPGVTEVFDDDFNVMTSRQDRGQADVDPSVGLPSEKEISTRENNVAKIKVVVRKRPLNKKEVARKEEDIVTVCDNHYLAVHEPKLKSLFFSMFNWNLKELTFGLCVKGGPDCLCVEKHEFCFDAVLDEHVTNDEVYRVTVEPVIPIIFQRTKATCFAYGQTGSGKTFTMQPLPLRAAEDLVRLLHHPTYRNQRFKLWLSFFEIYGGKLFDLLSDRKKLCMREDGRQQVCIVGLQEFEVSDVQIVKEYIERGNAARSTGSTGANEESSRSHAILQLVVKKHSEIKDSRRNNDGNETKSGKVVGKISFIDLAGSERGADTTDNDRQTRIEGAEINKSLLALKECIRALDNDQIHIPFRGSKLTEVLRDSFVGNSRNRLKVFQKAENAKKDQVASAFPPANKESMSAPSFPISTDVEDVYEQYQEVKVVDTGRRVVEKDNMPYNPAESNKQPSSNYPFNWARRYWVDTEERVQKVSPPRRKAHRDEKSEKLGNWLKNDGSGSDLSATSYKPQNEEEALIAAHRKEIEDTMEIVREEMKLLAVVDQPGSRIDNYVTHLSFVLSRKAAALVSLQARLARFQHRLKEQEILSRKRVPR
ncbi:P-loop containing nucleoside triphosphate hydrolases superfamily protein [Actinidia rufa]|uniref:Kinesin-like protein n=1 Tax=Actinidia rufa TaxID=165716 RepID=A0A7J0GT85_9ERIC|nr:P-loop containing nucleoside triphosphate hydrolases superfamily protein [Actinidia rufa]